MRPKKLVVEVDIYDLVVKALVHANNAGILGFWDIDKVVYNKKTKKVDVTISNVEIIVGNR